MVKLILTRDVSNLGRAGDMVEVRPGFARNYLIPQGSALEATPGNLRQFEDRRRRIERRARRARKQAELRAQDLVDVEITFRARAGEGGQLFGSVTAADVQQGLEDEGVKVDRRAIGLEQPIKKLGVYEVPVRLHAEVEPAVKVWVIAED
ncbi:MAG: 50S ribosomal protein L9 [Gemmatimonadetes bacterium]|nr:50S ribosomal protein L9 [Gemmatimonadota bacterium]